MQRIPFLALARLVIISLPAGAAGLSAASLSIEVRDGSGEPVEDAAVWASPVDRSPEAAGPEEAAIDQIDREFIPRVSVVRAGTPVLFPNNDNIRHHVYSFSEAKRFELPLYKGVPAEPVVFDTPGVVTLGCNIHDWMVAYVVIVETPFSAVTGGDGAAAIDDLPPGDYEVEIWHSRSKAGEETHRREVSIGDDDDASRLEFEVDLQPDWQQRRGGRAGGRYR